VKTEDRTL